MNLNRVEKIANAVLYEGYILYPYRPTALKNQQRFNFGVLSPRAYSESQQGSDPWKMQTECLLQRSRSHTRCKSQVSLVGVKADREAIKTNSQS